MTLTREQQETIKPGEFTFCGRCGENVQYGDKDFMCRKCHRTLFRSTEDIPKSERSEMFLAECYEHTVSVIIKEHRKDLADLRLGVIKA